jgi:guanine deaminase
VPQYPAVARGTSDLLPWLRQYIFPLEREFTGARGRREASAFMAELARHGTTTAMLYTAIFEDSCDAAFQAAAEKGLRVIMGKMMMDVGSYGQLQPSKILSVSLAESERLIKKWHGANDGLLEYAVSPRFAVSCTEKLMRSAAELAQRYGTYVQTHLSENQAEMEKVRHLFAHAADYTDVYAQYGLLGPKTVLGHCVHLNDRERGAIAASGAGIAHCPTANLFLRSGILPLDKARAAGIRVGLGSDVAAGSELNLWHVMRTCIESQVARSFYEPDVAVPSPADALHLATQGAADVLGKGRIIGSFDIGKEADLAVMDLGAMLPYRRSSKATNDLTAEDVVSLCIYRGGPDAVLETFVRGRSVYRAPEPELF